MKVISENHNYKSYLELKEQQEELFSRLVVITELDRELSDVEEEYFNKLCGQIDDVSFKIRRFMQAFLEETDKLLSV